jgi:hypothetical protein
VHGSDRIAVVAAAVLVSVLVGLVAGQRGTAATTSATGSAATECPPGDWIRSNTAQWLRRVVEVAGYRIEGCTGSSWIAGTPRTQFYVWSTEPWRRSPELDAYTDVSPLPLPIYTDGTRLAWQAQGLGIWVEPGPSATDVLPGKSALSWLQISSRGLPRVYRPIAMMDTPPAVLARCRSDRDLRAACPTRIPRIGGWEAYPRPPRVVEGIFGLQLGGEIPGKPELMRPPRILHIEVARDPDRWVPFRWPTSGAVAPRDGLVREERTKPVLLRRVTWAGKQGSVALAPGYPVGGSQGNHVMFRWRAGGRPYVIGMHAWEPFSEAYATLRRVVASLPRS